MNKTNIANKKCNLLSGIKSKYIMKKIFNHIQQTKKLKMINYNKELQNKLNIDINDYKRKYCIIEIELEIVPSQYLPDTFNNFINVPYDERQSNFKCYFNWYGINKKRNYLIKNEWVRKIKIKLEYDKKSFKNLFKGCLCLKK